MTTIKNQTISSARVREVLRNNRDWEYTEAFAKGWNDVLDGKPWDYDFCDRAAIHDKLLEKRLMVRISGTNREDAEKASATLARYRQRVQDGYERGRWFAVNRMVTRKKSDLPRYRFDQAWLPKAMEDAMMAWSTQDLTFFRRGDVVRGVEESRITMGMDPKALLPDDFSPAERVETY